MDYPEYLECLRRLLYGSLRIPEYELRVKPPINFAAHKVDGERREVNENGGWKPLSSIAKMADYTPPNVQERRNRARKACVCVDNGYDYWKD